MTGEKQHAQDKEVRALKSYATWQLRFNMASPTEKDAMLRAMPALGGVEEQGGMSGAEG